MSYEIYASQWLNTAAPLSLASLRGRVVVVTAFQMLCPGCVINSLPQAKQLDTLFSRDDLRIIGLHSVFEHHDVMGPAALQVFAHEYRLNFPIAIDQASESGPLPRTMKEWGLGGTPSTIIFDRDGKLALKELGHLDDLRLGAFVGQLIARQSSAQDKSQETVQAAVGMDGTQAGGPRCTY
ncbi:peroxiredoxin family protein [Alcaligenes parafaecalis]|uniref:Redoxin family protein n=1 Tax=Alcaligenes parafaecalis TaxID=171260 RepID=A0ABT3VIW3_9BURK|nr:redoxin family protein [Alcaligenes parafaecalis]MCX5463444.1 redoxin family protein [Alcaligenes parafaecalis]